MTKPSVRTAHLKDTADLYNDIAKGQLPAVSSSSRALQRDPPSRKSICEAFTRKIVTN